MTVLVHAAVSLGMLITLAARHLFHHRTASTRQVALDTTPYLPLAWMVATHGVANAVGFALCGVLAMRREGAR